MSDKERLNELDRNMDTVFDTVFMLTLAMDAVVQSLPPAVAALAAERMSESLAQIARDKQVETSSFPGRLRAWRDAARLRASNPPPATGT